MDRGELGPGGKYAEWDEPTWDRRRAELAARPRPAAGLPFPGHVVADPLHWLADKYENSDGSRDVQLPLLDELVRQCEQTGDRNGAARWRHEIERRGYRPAEAPHPREARP